LRRSRTSLALKNHKKSKISRLPRLDVLEALERRELLAAHIVGSAINYATIQAAVDAASPGATINVDAGTYAELVTITKSLTLRGAQAGIDTRSNKRPAANESIINGQLFSTSLRTGAFRVLASDVTIDGFICQGNNTASTSAPAGIVLGPSIAGSRILNNIVRDNVTGLYLSNNSATKQGLIQHNVFLNNNAYNGNNSGRGIYSDGEVSGGKLTNVLIDGNDIICNLTNPAQRYQGGIALESRTANSQSNITVTNNVFDGVGKVLFFNASNIVCEYNVVTHNLDQWSCGFRFEGGVNGATIRYNTIYNNTGPGICIDAHGFGGDNSGFVVQYNNIFNNNTAYGYKYGLAVNGTVYNGTLDARFNYWGAANGPSGQGTGSGDAVWGNGQYGNSATSWSTQPGSEVIFSNWLTTPFDPIETPYLGLRPVDGAPIQAEDYNHGAEGIGYHDTTAGNSGGRYRTGERMDVEASTDTGGGFDVSSVVAGEWLNYNVNLSATGAYSIDFRVANGQTTAGKFHLEVDGVNVTGSLNVPPTGGWQTWTTVTASNINLTAGAHKLRLVMDTNGNGATVGNFNWFKLTTTASPVPSAPTGLAVGAVTTSQIALSWTNTAANATGVKVQRSTDGTTFNTVTTLAATATSYSDSGLSAATKYYYRVLATNASGDSSPSNVVNATTAAVAQPPSAPSGLAVGTVTASQISVSWTNTASNATGVKVQRSPDGTTFTTLTTLAATATSYTDSGLAASTKYYYRVLATNAVGDSGPSNVVNATTTSVGQSPTYLSSLNWTSATSGWGTVQKDKSVAGKTLTLAGTTYTKGLGTHADSTIVYTLGGQYSTFQSDVGVDAGAAGVGTVIFKVIGDGVVLFTSAALPRGQFATINISIAGVNALSLVATSAVAGDIDYCHADWANAAVVGTPSAPLAPSGLTAVAQGSNAIKLTWTNNSSNQTGFTLQRSTDGTTFTTISTTIAASATSYTDSTGLSAATKYYYRVYATNGTGPSPASNIANATTLAVTTTTYVSDLTATSATTGWGTIQKDASIAGNAITLGGATYAKGIGTHADSTITYNLAGGYKTFLSDVGVDDEVNGKGTAHVVFQVYGDGVLLFDSGTVTNGTAPISLSIDVTGVQTLTLVAKAAVAGDIDYAHADWAGARLLS
jgi:nitrous oxidase accessory protein NosD